MSCTTEKPSSFVSGLQDLDALCKSNRAAGRLPLEGYAASQKRVNEQMTPAEMDSLFAGNWMIVPGKTPGPGSMF